MNIFDHTPSGHSRALFAALSAWTAAVLIITVMVLRAPLDHSVLPIYHAAAEKWLLRLPLYAEYAFHYPPQFLIVFMPFHVMPAPLGDILWRLLSSGLLVWSLWKIIAFAPGSRKILFLYATGVALLPSLAAMRNGQANVFFAAFMTLAAACLARSQWWLASLCLLAAVAMKGAIGLVMLLLAALWYRALVWRLLPGLALFLAITFLFSDTAYVAAQYQQYSEHLQALSVNKRHYANLAELLRRLGLGLSERVLPLVSFGAGLATLAAWWAGARRHPEPDRALLLLGLTATYLMLFNPMTELNSYVIIAPVLAFHAARLLESRGSTLPGYCLGLIGVSLGLFPELFRWLDQDFGGWWNPLMMLPVGALLLSMSFSGTFAVNPRDMADPVTITNTKT